MFNLYFGGKKKKPNNKSQPTEIMYFFLCWFLFSDLIQVLITI